MSSIGSFLGATFGWGYRRGLKLIKQGGRDGMKIRLKPSKVADPITSIRRWIECASGIESTSCI
jgi:hypothetical protein